MNNHGNDQRKRPATTFTSAHPVLRRVDGNYAFGSASDDVLEDSQESGLTDSSIIKSLSLQMIQCLPWAPPQPTIVTAAQREVGMVQCARNM